jgi:hypothetical protein
LRAKRCNLAFHKNKTLKIASTQKSIIAMTEQAFFNRLLDWKTVIDLVKINWANTVAPQKKHISYI